MSTMFEGDQGTELVLDCGTDISTASGLKIIARRPDGLRVEWLAVLDGTNSVMYVIQPGELKVGCWQFQSYVEMGGGKWYGEVVKHTVARPL